MTGNDCDNPDTNNSHKHKWKKEKRATNHWPNICALLNHMLHIPKTYSKHTHTHPTQTHRERDTHTRTQKQEKASIKKICERPNEWYKKKSSRRGFIIIINVYKCLTNFGESLDYCWAIVFIQIIALISTNEILDSSPFMHIYSNWWID